jgi:hypothetical protein
MGPSWLMVWLLFVGGPFVSVISGAAAVGAAAGGRGRKAVFIPASIAVVWFVSFVVWALLAWGMTIGGILKGLKEDPRLVLLISVPLIPSVLALVVYGLRVWCSRHFSRCE